MKIISLICLAVLFGFVFPAAATAQLQPQSENVSRLEGRVKRLETKIAQIGNDQGLTLILFGAFCALWAQNSGRNAWLWFLLGLFFSFIMVFVVLWKNSNDIDRRRRAAAKAT